MTSAFNRTKQRLADAALLFHPVSGAELKVYTDASTRAIAGAVHQVVSGRLQPLGFFSRHTSPAETRYSAYDLELLAVYSTIIKFRHMLEGRKVRIDTNRKPLTSAFVKARDPVSNCQTTSARVYQRIWDRNRPRTGPRQRCGRCLHSPVRWSGGASSPFSLSRTCWRRLGRSRTRAAKFGGRAEHVPQAGIHHEVSWGWWAGGVWYVIGKATQVLVPESRRQQVCSAVHRLAHPSGRATLAILSKSYVWQGMRRDVLNWARQCQDLRNEQDRQAQLPARASHAGS